MRGVRIANGDTCYTGTNPNSPSPNFVQTFCDVGYELSSRSEVRTCQSDSTWSGSSAHCVRVQGEIKIFKVLLEVFNITIIFSSG